MGNFAAIKGINYSRLIDIENALKFIKEKIENPNNMESISFQTYYHTMVDFIETNNLYEVLEITPEYLAQQSLFVEKFRQAFSEKFVNYSRRTVINIRNSFKSSVNTYNNVFFGQSETVDHISNVLSEFKEYAEFIVKLYGDNVKRLYDTVSEEQNKIDKFKREENISGRLEYYAKIGNKSLYRLKFIKEYNMCSEILETLEMWNKLEKNVTDILYSTENLCDEMDNVLEIVSNSTDSNQ